MRIIHSTAPDQICTFESSWPDGLPYGFHIINIGIIEANAVPAINTQEAHPAVIDFSQWIASITDEDFRSAKGLSEATATTHNVDVRVGDIHTNNLLRNEVLKSLIASFVDEPEVYPGPETRPLIFRGRAFTHRDYQDDMQSCTYILSNKEGTTGYEQRFLSIGERRAADSLVTIFANAVLYRLQSRPGRRTVAADDTLYRVDTNAYIHHASRSQGWTSGQRVFVRDIVGVTPQ